MSGYFKDKEPAEFKGRAHIAYVMIVFAFFILAVRFWYLQAKEHDYYAELSQNNSTRLIKSPAPRGLVYDRTGVEMAVNRPGFDLYLVPEDVQDWDKTKEMLKRLVGIEAGTIDEKLAKAKRRPRFQAVTLKEDLSWEEMVTIESYKFEMPGVMLDVAPKRSYLYGEATAHLLGYLGEMSERDLKEREGDGKYSSGDLIGKYGLERSFEEELKGTNGGKEIEVDALGRKIKVVSWAPPHPGDDMTLTIDMRAQIAAWTALNGHVGAAVAIEPSTGRVLALVSTPAFDPNALSSGISQEDWAKLLRNPLKILNNRTIQGQYPPASTFKPIHALAALEEGAITPSTIIYSGPSFRFAGRDYRDWKEEGHGNINVKRAIIESSDTFFYQTGLKLGVDSLARYAESFGFGRKTGIELLNEKSGLVPSSAWKKKAFGERWYDGETISVAVGQGYMLATPLQLANAYAAIANGGTLYTPQLVESIYSGGRLVKKMSAQARGRLAVSSRNLDHVKDGLRGVVSDDGGTARFLRYAKLDIAGKTGTAQVKKMLQREKDVLKIEYRYRDHAWFAGYAPYNDPKIAVAVIVEHGGFGASAAAPIAREIFKAYLAGGDAPVPEMRQSPFVEPVPAPAQAQMEAARD
ncbi:MAG: penicillin-binding protein 2 [Deltaproteobacteria bacterium]|nr:penicillin-binding protein 2 [Deltaproteobacteria bacterium]